jgi:indole-3-glycerol phosphate synthase
MSDLAGMVAHVAARVEKLKREEPVATLRSRPLYSKPTRPLAPALVAGARIVEVRFAGEDGALLVPREKATAEEAARLAAAAQKEGAAAVAVWCERNFHAGDYSHLEAARAKCPKLILIARDVVVDAWQLERIRAAGADAVELMPEILGPARLPVAAFARKMGLAPVVLGPGPTVRAL